MIPSLNEIGKRFTSESYVYTGGRYKSELFRYRLLSPSAVTKGEEYPLVVWLHGFGDGAIVGHNLNLAQLQHTHLLFADGAEAPPNVFVLAFQCPKEQPVWFRRRGMPELRFQDGKGDEMLTVLVEVIDVLCREYPIDPDRISIVGISSGGTGAWELAMRYPNRFSALVPCASAGGDVSRLERIVKLPTWAFHSAHDFGTPPEGVKETIQALRRIGGSAYLTLVDSGNHDCWTVAFRDYGILDWILAQERGRSTRNSVADRFNRAIGVWIPSAIAKHLAALLLAILLPSAAVLAFVIRQKTKNIHRGRAT